MNVRLKKTFGWYSGLVIEDRFQINHYTTELELLTVSDDQVQQNIAYERMKFWFYDIMDNAVFVSETHPDIDRWRETSARVIAFPTDPVDQIIGIMLCSKLNAVMEDRIVVTDTEIWSKCGDGMSYLHNWKESQGPLSESGWWSDARPIYNALKTNNSGNIVNLDRVAEWKSHDLDWDTNNTNAASTVVFGRFDRDGNK